MGVRDARELVAGLCAALGFVLSAGDGEAAVTILSQIREVSLHGSFVCPYLPTGVLYDEQESMSTSGRWDVRLPASVPETDDYASQYSSIRGGSIGRIEAVGVTAARAYACGGQYCQCYLAYAESITPISRLEVTFSVDESIAYRIVGITDIGPYEEPSSVSGTHSTVTLRSSGGELRQCSDAHAASNCASATDVWGEPALLAPGTYTLEAVAQGRPVSSFKLGKDEEWNWIVLEVHQDWSYARFNFKLEICEGGACFTELEVCEEGVCVPGLGAPAMGFLALCLASAGLRSAPLATRCRRRGCGRGALRS